MLTAILTIVLTAIASGAVWRGAVLNRRRAQAARDGYDAICRRHIASGRPQPAI